MNFDRIRAVSKRSIVTLMLCVAIAALLIAGTRNIVERNLELKSATAAHQSAAEAHATSAQVAELSIEVNDDPKMKEWLTRVASHYRVLERKHSEAALKPWEHVPPDPLPLPAPASAND